MNKSDNRVSQQVPLPFLAGYGLALASTALAALARWMLPWALTPAPYLGFYPAVVVSAALGGVGPGLVATFASLFLVNFVFGHFNIHDQGAMMRQVIWVTASIGVSLLAGMQRTARTRERRQAVELRRLNDELELRVEERTREIKDAEKVLKEMNESLEQRVDERTAELQAASTKLLDSSRAALNMMEDAVIARRQAEETNAELRDSEERYRSLFTTLIEGFCIIEVLFDADDRPVDYRFLECNPAFEAQTGLENAQGKRMREFAPEHEAHWFEIYGKVAVTGEPVRFMNEAKALNRWYDVSAYRIGGQDSRKVAILFNDITDRRHAEEALSRAKDEWERTFDSVPDLITILDNHHRILRVNRAMAEKLGRHPKECIGLTCYAAIHGADGPPPFCPHAMTIGDGQGHDAEVHEDNLGGDFLVSTTPLLDAGGKLIATVHVARDITDRKRAEDALRLAHAELEVRVAERTEELTSAVNILQEEITDRLKAEEQLLRLNRLHAVLSETSITIIRATERDSLFRDFCRIAVEHGGFLLSWIGLVDGDEVKIVASAGAIGYLDDIRISVREEPEGLGPTGMSIRDGSYYICNDFLGDPCTRPWHEIGRAHGIGASASIALKQEGEVIGALTLYADTKDFFDQQHVELLLQMGTDLSFALDNFCRETRRREAEEALKAETARRLQAMEELRENERMLMQQGRQAAMGEMIGNIAHQWRQPLNVLGLIIQELPLTYELDALTRENLDTSVKKATQVIHHMSHTIDDFRNFFSPDKEKTLFKANDIVAKTVSLIEGSFREQRIAIELRAKDDIFIYGYPNEYSQVILNILINARDAFIERRNDGPKTVTITLSRENDKAVATIADNAGGIATEIMDKIFDPYFTTKGPDKGTGVGLFMSKTIIEKNMNGRLSACNSGNGAEFRIEV